MDRALPRMNVMLDFICIELVESTCQEHTESDKIQNEKFLPTLGLELSGDTYLVCCCTD